eukprot:m.351971 g.351971  ORF g.351971 m.351971 type:complete len:85 (+) comp16415_c0_seq1:1532-1786(+)
MHPKSKAESPNGLPQLLLHSTLDPFFLFFVPCYTLLLVSVSAFQCFLPTKNCSCLFRGCVKPWFIARFWLLSIVIVHLPQHAPT